MSQPGQKMHNAKAVAGKAKKAEAEGKKDAKKQEEHEKSQAADWAVGSNARGAAKASSTADKEAERARKEAERRALLEEEDASTDAAAAKAKKPSASKKKSKDDQNAMLLAGLDAGKKKPAKVQEPTPAKVAAPPAAVKKPSGLAEPMRLEENMNRMQVDEESASGINQALDMCVYRCFTCQSTPPRL